MRDFTLTVGNQGDLWFDWLYLFVFVISLGWLLLEGNKRGFHLLSWLLAIACTRFLFIVGTKLFSFSGEEWRLLFFEMHLSPTSQKTLFGGLLLCIVFYPLLRRLLRLSHSALDAFAVVLPLGIAVQRVGCFMAGCCHGEATGAAWGVQYTPYTLAHYHHYTAGLIGPGDILSLPVHPAQLYEGVAALLVVGLLLRFRRRIKAPGNLFVTATALYSFFRFGTEFFRYSQAYAVGGHLVGGLKVMQWILLLLVVSLSLLLALRERRHTHSASQDLATAPAMPVLLGTLTVLAMATWSLRNWLTYTELLVLNIALIPAIALTVIQAFRAVTLPQQRWATLATLVLPLLLMSQTLPPPAADSAKVKTYKTFRIGYGEGDYVNSHNIGQGSGCDRVSNTTYFEQAYDVGGAGYSVTEEREKSTFTYGMNGYVGKHTETRIPDMGEETVPKETTIWGLNPHVQFDTKWLGMGLGLHAGNLSYTLENKSEDGSPRQATTGSKRPPVYPQASLRVGPRHILFADVRLADHFPSPMPGLRYTYGVGSGFGLKNGSYVRYGSNSVNSILSGYVVVNNRFVLEPLYLWGNDSFTSKKQRQLSLGMHYRFD